MTTAIAAAWIKAELLKTYTGLLIEANDYQTVIAGDTPFMLLQYPPSVTMRRNVGQPALYQEVGAFSLRYHELSGNDLTPSRVLMSALESFFRDRSFPSTEIFQLKTEGRFTGYESDGPTGNWYELHLTVPFQRRFMGE